MTTSLLLENDIVRKKGSYGFSFGVGATKETLQPQQYNTLKVSNSYATISAGTHFSYRISKDFAFQLQPILLWQDPLKTLGVITGRRRANLAGEDLSAVVNFGLRYRLAGK